jgi:hypothetical protein
MEILSELVSQIPKAEDLENQARINNITLSIPGILVTPGTFLSCVIFVLI